MQHNIVVERIDIFERRVFNASEFPEAFKFSRKKKDTRRARISGATCDEIVRKTHLRAGEMSSSRREIRGGHPETRPVQTERSERTKAAGDTSCSLYIMTLGGEKGNARGANSCPSERARKEEKDEERAQRVKRMNTALLWIGASPWRIELMSKVSTWNIWVPNAPNRRDPVYSGENGRESIFVLPFI